MSPGFNPTENMWTAHFKCLCQETSLIKLANPIENIAQISNQKSDEADNHSCPIKVKLGPKRNNYDQ